MERYLVKLIDGEELYAYYNERTGHWLDEFKDKEIGFYNFINNKQIANKVNCHHIEIVTKRTD